MKTFNWRKKGILFSPSGEGNMLTHAQIMAPIIIDDKLRIFFQVDLSQE